VGRGGGLGGDLGDMIDGWMFVSSFIRRNELTRSLNKTRWVGVGSV